MLYLDRFGLYKWNDYSIPIINKFMAAIEHGEVDEEFWDSMYTIK